MIELLQTVLGAVAVLLLAVLVVRSVGDGQARERGERDAPD